MRSRPALGAKNRWPVDSSSPRSSGSARNTSRGTGLLAGPSQATSKQNDLRRTANECAGDLVLVSEPGTRPGASGSARHSVRTRSRMSSGTSMGALARALWRAAGGSLSFGCRTGDLPAERGPDCGCGAGVVLGWFDEAPLVERAAVGEGAPVAETGKVEGPDVHDRLEAAQFVAGRLHMPAVGVDGSVDPLLVRLAWVPRTRAPHQASEVREARSAPGRLPVDRDWPLCAQDDVIGGVEEIFVKQALRKAVTVVGRAHLVAELLEPLALGGRDLGVDGVEKRQGGQQVLTRGALTARVLTARSTRAADGILVRQRVQRSEQLTHHGELRGTVGEPDAFNEPRHEDRTAIEVRYPVIGRQALRRKVMLLQESQDRGVTLDTGTRPSRGKRAGDPRAAVLPVDAEHVGLVHTELRRRDRINAVAIAEMGEKPLSHGLMVHPRTETLEIHQRFGIALPSLLGVAPDNLLEAGVPGHGQASP